VYPGEETWKLTSKVEDKARETRTGFVKVVPYEGTIVPGSLEKRLSTAGGKLCLGLDECKAKALVAKISISPILANSGGQKVETIACEIFSSLVSPVPFVGVNM
jgi:hypothetical protein